jgi:hypothetical protein
MSLHIIMEDGGMHADCKILKESKPQLRGGMQIFGKTLTGKSPTLEVESSETQSTP